MTAPARARAPWPDDDLPPHQHDADTPDVSPSDAQPPSDAPSPGERGDAPLSHGDSVAVREQGFVWPPPVEELDAMEIVHLTPPSEPPAPESAAAESATSSAAAAASSLTTLDTPARQQLAALRELTDRQKNATRHPLATRALSIDAMVVIVVDKWHDAPPGQVLRLAGAAALVLVALVVGALLGVRDAHPPVVSNVTVGGARPDAPANAGSGGAASRSRSTDRAAPRPSSSGASRSGPTAPDARAAAAASPGAGSSTTASASTPTSRDAAESAPVTAPAPASPSVAGALPAPSSSASTIADARTATVPKPDAREAAEKAAASRAAAPVSVSPIGPADRAVAAPDAPEAAVPETQPVSGVGDALQALNSVASPARRAETSGVVGPGADAARIRETIGRYERAYDALDARAAAVVWPTLDVGALSRAFSTLKSQAVTFDRCSVNTVSAAAATATASCSGTTTVVRRIGHPSPIVEPLQWTFTLHRHADSWQIDTVRIAR